MRFAAVLVSVVATSLASADDLKVLSVTPANAAINVGIARPISVHFDRPVAAASVTPASFWVFAKMSGTLPGAYVFSDGGATVTFVPDNRLLYGESVVLLLSHDLRGADRSPLRGAGYASRFTTRTRPAPMSFQIVTTLGTDIAGEGTTPYGGNPSDMNHDGWPDIVLANEATADIRVFPNAANGTVAVGPIVQPTASTGSVPSPSDQADFNHDGHTDLVVGCYGDGSMSILLGNGDGTFAPVQSIDCGSSAVGVAALDLDGDGDFDVACANPFSDQISIAFNDGEGTFGSPTSFDGGGSTEWGLTSADMNNDGIFDIVIGAQSNNKVVVRLGQGNGTVGPPIVQNSGGASWMLSIGDLNGDGFEDVAAANGSSAKGSILMGDGTGALAAPTSYSVDPFVVSTDLADLDGDGDLDWMLSSFGGDWRVLKNVGGGVFVTVQEFDSTAAASCILPLDIDGDGDIDLGLVDENADELKLVANSGYTPLGDLNLDHLVNGADLAVVLGAWGQSGTLLLADLSGDDKVDGADLALVLGGWTG